MSRKDAIDTIKAQITKQNCVKLLDTFAYLFDHSIILRQLNSSIEITYATPLIYDTYHVEIVQILKIIYPGIKKAGSYKIEGNQSILHIYVF